MARGEQVCELQRGLALSDRQHDTLRADADAKDEAIAELKRKAEEQV